VPSPTSEYSKAVWWKATTTTAANAKNDTATTPTIRPYEPYTKRATQRVVCACVCVSEGDTSRCE